MDNHDPNDPVAMYIREAASVEPLSKAEESELFQRLGRSGNWDDEAENAARRLIESHLRLVVTIAERHSSCGVPLLDLIQEGNIGLFDAVKRFAVNPSGEFSVYAAACIEDAIANAVAKSQ